MTTDVIADTPSVNAPGSALKALDKLVGTWSVSGPGHHGTVIYRWMDGGHFLIQDVNLIQDGQATTGVEYIGVDKDTGHLASHFFGSSGDILEYVYELVDDELTIWFGQPGSPARYRGTFTADGTGATGAWEWPGGGYSSTMTRVEPQL